MAMTCKLFHNPTNLSKFKESQTHSFPNHLSLLGSKTKAVPQILKYSHQSIISRLQDEIYCKSEAQHFSNKFQDKMIVVKYGGAAMNSNPLQLRAIKGKLGDNDDDEDDVATLERKMQSAGMPADIWKHAQRELRRLKEMQPQQPDYNSSWVYLELLADLPWQKASEELELDLKAARERLDSNHHGLVKVKERIIEYLAFCKRKPEARGPVLCFVGPPGVGKTSLASSIAKSLGRKFIRIPLGGVNNEDFIRGSTIPYSGGMQGRIIDGLKKVGVCNPVMLLDEIDKIGSDYSGELALALLEVLDPEQNKTFNDHYLNVPFDLSKVVFVATANRTQPISNALLDMMEVIELPGYSPEEKLRIATRHLIPRVLEQHGLTTEFLQIPEDMVKIVIQRYTSEAGVRNLERNLAALARAAAVRVAEMEVIPLGMSNQEILNAFRVTSPFVVDEAMLDKVLGMRAIKGEPADENDMAILERKMQSAGMPADVWNHAQRELRRLKKMEPHHSEYKSSWAYLKLFADLPWQKASEEPELDLKAARERLDIDHYGLAKVKQRIIECLAVLKLKLEARGPVLCFVGPPGVGKTSLASSIAASLGRKFIRIPLGGVYDEDFIRGSRRPNSGGMPGRIIDGLKKVGVCNPVILLDEIDKIGSDFSGELVLALLEVLDPGQNITFNDHYLNVPFDLSKVVFVATANRTKPIPKALLDRMEVIELPGYTPEEKLGIATRHLIPRVLEQHGLTTEFLQIPEDMVKIVIQRYTSEAGVRNLERNLAALARTAAVRVAEQEHLSKDVHHLGAPMLESRVVDGAEVEMEVIPMGVSNQEISDAFRVTSPLVVDEAMLEKVLGMRAIKGELGDNDDDKDDVATLERKMQSAGLPADIWKDAQRELRRLEEMEPWQSQYQSSRDYLALLADLPWQKASEDLKLDLKAARERLDSDHYGLVKVKQRIIEYLAVRKLKSEVRGPVLCFVGPPGVGKTSLASSIAASLGRKFIRISLGGVEDESNIRGHRRTYVGSKPGRLIDGLKKVGVCNPVMLLDEIDKTGSDVRGDPASALLEVLDPEQNKTFKDHYLNVPYDLSKVVFVATANRMEPIPPALLDRMEVIELPGYTPEEKLGIATRHLIPRVLEQHGLTSEFLQIPEDMVKIVIQRYTREAGVRKLERNLAALARAAAFRVVEQEHLSKDVDHLTAPMLESRVVDGAEVEMEVIPMGVSNQEISDAFRVTSPFVVDEPMLEKVLGPPRFDDKETGERVSTPGVTVGLVWTSFGGEVQFVEAIAMAGKGELHLTGQLGDVIKESAQIALTWVRSRAAELNLASSEGINLLESRDVHIHFPDGAVPKDGPSAGVTLVTSLVSLFSQKRVRADTAMTGEITLRGLVLPVGGIKDKVLAAHRCGIKRVILPERNVKDLVEVPETVLSNLEILFVKRIEDVLEQALEAKRMEDVLEQALEVEGGCP